MTTTHHGVVAYAQRNSEAEVLKRHGGLVRRIALTLAARCGIDPSDLWSAGAFGLFEAVRRFDPAHGVRLETFIAHRIRGAMLDELRRLDRLPRRLRGRLSELERVRNRIRNATGAEPTREALAEALGLEAGAIDRLDSLTGEPVELNEGSAEADNVSVDELMVSEEQKEDLRAALTQLPERQQLVLSLRYAEELTLREIAELLKVSEPRICQIHNAAVQRLRQILSRGT